MLVTSPCHQVQDLVLGGSQKHMEFVHGARCANVKLNRAPGGLQTGGRGIEQNHHLCFEPFEPANSCAAD